MEHTIISWDCCFRNFHHLVDGLLCQNFPKDKFELIFVEQRSKEESDSYNLQSGLPTLGDRLAKAGEEINFKIIYLGEQPSTPYHLGRCNNAGLGQAQGSIISVMDGDQLLPPDFLRKLTDVFYGEPNSVVCVDRKMAAYPVGVRSYGDWIKAGNDFAKCLTACKDRFDPTPKKVNNYGPMISASKVLWKKIGGYDPAPIWSTFLSTSGADVAARLAIAAGRTAEYLTACFTVHPWHPVTVDSLRGSRRAQLFFALQRELTAYSVKHGLLHHKDRENLSQQIHEINREFIHSIINWKEIDELQLKIGDRSLLMEKISCRVAQLRGMIAHAI